jgi:hypothetical protein
MSEILPTTKLTDIFSMLVVEDTMKQIYLLTT